MSAVLVDQEGGRTNKTSKAAQQLRAWHRRRRNRAAEVSRPWTCDSNRCQISWRGEIELPGAGVSGSEKQSAEKAHL